MRKGNEFLVKKFTENFSEIYDNPKWLLKWVSKLVKKEIIIDISRDLKDIEISGKYWYNAEFNPNKKIRPICYIAISNGYYSDELVRVLKKICEYLKTNDSDSLRVKSRINLPSLRLLVYYALMITDYELYLKNEEPHLLKPDSKSEGLERALGQTSGVYSIDELKEIKSIFNEDMLITLWDSLIQPSILLNSELTRLTKFPNDFKELMSTLQQGGNPDRSCQA